MRLSGRVCRKPSGIRMSSIGPLFCRMAMNASESIQAMGTDIPLAVLSENHRPLFDYFKQMFAQVTNPPIDAIREKIVTSTAVYVGRDGNLLEEKSENCQVLKIHNPILTNTDMMKIKHMNHPGFQVAVVSILYYKSTKLKRAMDRLFVEVDKAYRDGANILVLSDRGVDENHMAIPSLLAVSAVHQHLVKTKKRTSLWHHSGIRRAAGSPPFCHTSGIRRLCRQPVSGPGNHPRADR